MLAPFPQPLAITALGGSVGTGTKPLEAEVVEFATLDALKAAPAGSLTGKIAFVIQPHDARRRTARGYGPGRGRAQRRVRCGRQGRGGAHDPFDRHRLRSFPAHRHAPLYRGRSQIPAAALSNPDADLLSNMLRRGQPVTVRLDIDSG